MTRVRSIGRMDQVFGALDGTGVAAIDLRPALQQAKTRQRIFDSFASRLVPFLSEHFSARSISGRTTSTPTS